MSIYEYFGRWLRVIDIEELGKVVSILNTFRQDKLCPSYKDIFKAFKLCPYSDCKVVFLAQDPYPQKNIATGICFGNNKEPLSPSLEVIKESCIDYTVPHNFIEFDNSLESWAKQGILMLNSALTCELGKPGSHTMLWRTFISKLLYNLSNTEPGIIYVLFGAKAQTFEPYINKQLNYIIKAEHPAYYARIKQPMPHKVFSDIDNLLKYKYNSTIKWYNEIN